MDEIFYKSARHGIHKVIYVEQMGELYAGKDVNQCIPQIHLRRAGVAILIYEWTRRHRSGTIFPVIGASNQ